MDERKKKAIEQYRTDLIASMDPLLVMDHLKSNVLSSIEREYIKESHSVRTERNRELIAIILRKREELGPFECFVNALKDTDENHKIMAEIILKAYRAANSELSDAAEIEDALKRTQESLKQKYLIKFRYVYPFSLPFTFDIENTWVSLALKEDSKDSQATEDHAKLLERAFQRAKMLIIEGDPASGKTSLMRKLAYEWAKELLHYNLVVYAEFRTVREKSFTSITDLVLGCSKEYLESEEFERLALLLSNKQFFIKQSILVLLDGYDESSLGKQCSELQKYLDDNTINKPLLFNIVITTRKGYLSHLRGYTGRFVFAEVLGFTTDDQKKKYIFNHFSSGANSYENIIAVHHLLEKNKNLNKLTEAPLFLTFTCLVHERIIDGSLLELYCNILWWLIDRHQKDFPDRDIPDLLGFKTDISLFTTRLHGNSSNKGRFKIIQDHYLEFTQLHSLGKMAFKNLEQSIFQPSDFNQFNLKPAIEQVGLLIRDEFYDKSFRLATTFSFPHKTIQEFLAAVYFFISDKKTDQMFSENLKVDTYEMNEYEKFLLRIALSNQIPINKRKQTVYFESITELTLDLTFDAINKRAGLNNELLNWFISHCINIQILEFNKSKNDEKEPQISVHVLSFIDLIHLNSLTFNKCIFEANSQISFINCPSLKWVTLEACEIKSSASIDFSKLRALDTLKFYKCTIELDAWQSITDEIARSSVKQLNVPFQSDFNELLNHLHKCNNVKKIEITIWNYNSSKDHNLLSLNDLINLHSLTFWDSTFEVNSQLSVKNCPFLKTLEFLGCEIKNGASIDFSKLPALDTLEFYHCTIDLKAWQWITDEISRISVKRLALTFWKYFNNEFLNQLQICNNVKKIKITIWNYNTLNDNNLLSFSELSNLHLLTFEDSTFEANSQISFTNCPFLKYLQFFKCEIKSSVSIEFSKLPPLENLQFYQCIINLQAWQLITDEIISITVKRLQLSSDFFEKEESSEFLIQLQKCECIWGIEIFFSIGNEEQLTTNLSNLAREMKGLKSITFGFRRSMNETNMKIIEKAGQERDPDFKTECAKETEDDQGPAKSDPGISLQPRSSKKSDRARRRCTCL